MNGVFFWALASLTQCMAIDHPDSTCFINENVPVRVAQVCSNDPEDATWIQDINDEKHVYRTRRGVIVVLPYGKCWDI